MIVFRVEHSSGHGPFYGIAQFIDKSVYDELLPCMEEFFGDFSNHPIPDREMCKDSHIGCISLSELAEWFNHERMCEILTANGFHISIYKVKKVIHGTKQLSFMKKNAVLLNTQPLSRLKGF